MLTINRHGHRHQANPPLNLHPPSSSSADVPPRPPPAPAETHTSPPSQPHPHPAKPDQKLLSFVLQALIMTLILSLFFVFVGVAVIIFLHLCLVGGALHRRHHRRNRPHSLPYRPGSYESPPGLSPAQLKTLPRTKLKAKLVSGQTSNGLCAICLENCIEGDWCRELPDCKHVFHANCVDTWLAKSPGCPVCRTTVRVSRKEEGATELGDCGSQLWYIFG